MERLGISSACFYPMTTEDSFLKLCKSDIKCIEIFFNSPSEIEKSFIRELKNIKNYYGITIPSIHPFMSFAESFYLFSEYERRFIDILDFYKHFFEVTNELGADYFILHGAHRISRLNDEEYFERYKTFCNTAKNFGVTVCQENVFDYKSQNIDFLEKMKKYIGDDFAVTLDIKQARKAGEYPFLFIQKLNSSIKHLHISDANSTEFCIPPGEGTFDFSELFNSLKNISYDGKYIIELYNHSYKNESQIFDSYKKISKLLVEY